ncbi:MAG: hypothetical protein Q8L49_08210 [Burkholderiaceae bacterium]|nr:hypothetical protein [Burkholderiaceae bacterium]
MNSRTLHRRHRTIVALATVTLPTGWAGSACAQAHPARPIKRLVAFGAGTVNDNIARWMPFLRPFGIEVNRARPQGGPPR